MSGFNIQEELKKMPTTPGVGPSRRKALMLYFKSIEAIREANVEELLEVQSINEKVAKDIYKFFHK